MVKNIKLVDSEEVVAMPEYDIKKLISDRDAFQEAAKERDDKIKAIRKKEREELNVQVNKLKKENEGLNSKIDSLQKIIKAKDDVIQKRDAELKTKNDEIRQVASVAMNYKQELIQIKQQLDAKPQTEFVALRQRLANMTK